MDFPCHVVYKKWLNNVGFHPVYTAPIVQCCDCIRAPIHSQITTSVSDRDVEDSAFVLKESKKMITSENSY